MAPAVPPTTAQEAAKRHEERNRRHKHRSDSASEAQERLPHYPAAGASSDAKQMRQLHHAHWVDLGFTRDNRPADAAVMPEDRYCSSKARRKPARFDAVSTTKSDFQAPRTEHTIAAVKQHCVHGGETKTPRYVISDLWRHSALQDGSGLVGMGGWRAQEILAQADHVKDNNFEDTGTTAIPSCRLRMPKDHPYAKPVNGSTSKVLAEYPAKLKARLVRSKSATGSLDRRPQMSGQARKPESGREAQCSNEVRSRSSQTEDGEFTKHSKDRQKQVGKKARRLHTNSVANRSSRLL